MDQLSAAKSYATLHHVVRRGQLYGLVPYTHHCQDVERVMVRFGEDRLVLRVCAWLHDIVEDTDVKMRDIEENFGEEVALLVGAVTSEEGPNRKVRNALTYPKIRAIGPDAVRLKLADRIANIENGGSSVKMYVREYPEFRFNLFRDDDAMNASMWSHLDGLIEKGRRA